MDKQHSSSFRASFLGSTPHPSAPISATATSMSTSPSLHSFGRRFRSKSTSPPAEVVASLEQATPPLQMRNSEAVRSAKRFLLSTVKSDWEYDPIYPPTQEAIHSLSHLKDVEYRRREDGSSDPGSDPEDYRDPVAWTDQEADPYKYEDPDAVASALSQKRRKRQRLFKEELQYNEGLRVFHERRNIWTCAVQRRKPGQPPTSTTEPRERENSWYDPNNSHTPFEFDASRPTSRGQSLPSTSCHSSPFSTASADKHGREADPTTRPQSQAAETFSDITTDYLLPVAPPLLPGTNPVRAAITPSMYPTIYSKVVLQSQTPSVPIPLPDITRAMVQGWRDEGNWPPRTTIVTSGNTAHDHRARYTAILAAGPGNTSTNTSRRSRIGLSSGERREGSMRKGMSGALRKALGLKGPSASLSGSNMPHGTNPHTDNSSNNNSNAKNRSPRGSLGSGSGIVPGTAPSPPTNSERPQSRTVEMEDADVAAIFE